MNGVDLIKALLHSVDFYWKKFFVLSLFLVAIFGGVIYVRNSNVSQASVDSSSTSSFSTFGEKNINIEVRSNGKVLVDGKDSSKSLKLFSDHDEVRIMLIDNPGVYIQGVTARMTLPQNFTKSEVEQVTYAVHGVGSYRNYIQNQRTLVYEANSITSAATLTIVAKFPKGMVQPSLSKRLSYYFTSISAQSYLIFSIILPLLTFSVTFFMMLKRRKDQIISLNVAPSDKLPVAISPAVVGVLIDGQVGSREVAATLIDLAERKYIYIVRKGEGFTFGKRRNLNVEESSELKPFEKMLLSKIFMAQDYRSTREDVEMRVGRHIFSRKMAQFFLDVYDQATNYGYFISNPASVHRRWRYAGIGLFLLSVLGFIQSAIYAPDPKFTLLFWVGSMAAAAVVVKISGLMPARSKEGSKALGPWMAFRKYLKLGTGIDQCQNTSTLFTQNLSYAIVFGVEDAWAKRFMRESFTKPDWYDSEETTTTLEEFIGGLFPLIAFTGTILANSHDPTVE